MSFIGYLLLTIFIWFFYNLFVKLILPVYRTTRQIKKQFKNMSEQRQQQPQNDPTPSHKAETAKQKAGEYIEFEEVK